MSDDIVQRAFDLYEQAKLLADAAGKLLAECCRLNGRICASAPPSRQSGKSVRMPKQTPCGCITKKWISLRDKIVHFSVDILPVCGKLA